jgi:murein DD-endopeptidase MepM/ murein hydrolase activator NlpD
VSPGLQIVASAAVGIAPLGAFGLTGGDVSPRQAYVAGRPVAIAFALDAPAPLALQVDVVREATRTPVRRFEIAMAVPGAAQQLSWDGLRTRGEVAPDGRYRIRVRAADGRARNAGTITLRSHAYPIRGSHADRGVSGTFGVGRSGGRTHEGFDVFAACGTPVVAARGGKVARVVYDPVLYGHMIVIRGAHTRRDYWYAHLARAPRLRAGDVVSTGQRIGSVGLTGNARTIGCQLHFELRPRGVPIDPAPELHAWDAWS